MAKKFTSGVYFILNEETKLIKIGCSKDINKRYKDLQSQNEHLGYTNKMILLDKILVENYYDLEQHIHNKFAEKRVINEWFRIDINDIKDLKELLSETSYRGFDSGYIKTDRNVSKEFLDMGLSYIDIGIIFILKDFIDNKNVLTIDEKPMCQKDIMSLLQMKKTSTSERMNFFHNKGVIKSIKISNKCLYIVNPKYFRLSNYDSENEYIGMFK